MRFLVVSRAERLKEHKQIADEYGTGFEINDFFEPDLLENENRTEELISYYRQVGIPPDSTIHGAFLDVTVFSQDAAIRRISGRRMEQSMEIAERLGVKGVVFHTNFNPLLDGKEYNQRVVEFTAAFLKKLLEKYPGIDIYLENMFERTPDILRRISDRLSQFDNYGVCLDYAHASIYGEDTKRFIEELFGYIRHIHINDNDLVHDLHLAVGDGKLDWKWFADCCRQHFADCSVLIETASAEAQRRSLEYIQNEMRLMTENERNQIPRGIHQVPSDFDSLPAGIKNRKDRCVAETEEIVMLDNQNIQEEGLLEKIFYYMNQLMDEKDFEKAISILTELGKTLAGSDRASFWYWDTKKRQYWTLAAWGSERLTIPEGTGVVGAAIQEKKTIIINKPYEDERFNPDVDKSSGYQTKSILCMPVTNEKGRIIGAFQAINKLDINGLDSDFGERDVKRLAMVAVFCGKTLESHILQRESQVDQLTGLNNRRGFYEYYAEKIQNADASGPVSVVICDIDFFKRVNDTYGHNAGDAVLIHVADILQSNLSAGDEVVRWGGEEFVFLLENKDLENAAAFAEGVRKQVESSVCDYEDLQIKVTMSFGVEELNRERTSDENIKRADEKLYTAKQSGRNRVIR